MLVFDYLMILFRIAWWTSAEKELTSWLSDCAVLLYAVLIVCVPFPYVVWGRMWNLIYLFLIIAFWYTLSFCAYIFCIGKWWKRTKNFVSKTYKCCIKLCIHFYILSDHISKKKKILNELPWCSSVLISWRCSFKMLFSLFSEFPFLSKPI